jgi:secreted trypsin-like serine protease
VSQAIVEPDYLATSGYDITLLKLSRNAAETPTPVSGSSETALWSAGTSETIVGWGTTSEGGDTPSVLQEANVPVTTDTYCSGAYSDFDATTMICAGFPQGGVDTCQGDSGGPMFGHTSAGALRVVGATSFGEGCARAGKPGVYARVGDTALREWIRSQTPAGRRTVVDRDATPGDSPRSGVSGAAPAGGPGSVRLPPRLRRMT